MIYGGATANGEPKINMTDSIQAKRADIFCFEGGTGGWIRCVSGDWKVAADWAPAFIGHPFWWPEQ